MGSRQSHTFVRHGLHPTAYCSLPTAPHPIGLIANPASGKDIRRLVAYASVFDNAEKRNMLRRVILGAVAAGVADFRYMPDDHGLVERAVEDLGVEACFLPVPVPGSASALDTTRAAEGMRAAGCAIVVTLGGDGTNRAVALGWSAAPLIPLSTGTNNVFPTMIEATVAGTAAGLIAAGIVPLERVSERVKVIHVEIDGQHEDLALIDAALVDGAFVGARALWDPGALRLAVLTRAEPAAVGLAAIGGLLAPLVAADDRALAISFGEGGCRLRAPIAPGLFREAAIAAIRPLDLDDPVVLEGPGMLALDGERERVLRPGQRAVLRVRRDGPRVVDVSKVLVEAARMGAFVDGPHPRPLPPLRAERGA